MTSDKFRGKPTSQGSINSSITKTSISHGGVAALSKNDNTKVVQNCSDEDNVVTTCGIGSWRPKWMQRFSSPLFFMLNMGLVGVIQGMTATLFFSSISTFEKRYAFDSKISGVILIADNFAEMLLNPIVGYLGVRFNRARLIAIGEVILSISCFITASPYFIYGPAKHLLNDESILSSLSTNRTNHFEMCPVDTSSLSHDCSNGQGATIWPAVFILIFGSFARGLGYTCYFVIGLPYLDDNISKNKSPVYIAVMQSIRLLGPAFGFILASFCLKFYENPFVNPGFGQNDPRFIGAWWLSFCITGALLFIVAIPMFCFPLQFKNATVKTAEVNKKIKESGGSIGAFKRTITNPLVMFYVIAHIFRYNGIGGFIMFKSKYIESQFRQSSSSASFLTGFSSFMPMAIGIMLGGIIIAYLKPKPRTIFILVFFVESVSIFSIGSGLFLGCDPINIAGKLNDVGQFSPQSTCNQGCECSTRVYSPICGPDSKTTYFSPCYGGCSSFNQQSSTFENCSCFSGTATKGFCKSDATNCNNLYKYITFVTLGGIVSSFARTPNSLIALRSVDPMDKGFAIGFSSTLMDIFAFMQYPVIFGYIADSACLIWEKKCGKTGNCWVYDHDKFRKYLHGASITFIALGSVFDLMMIFFADRVQNFYDDDEEDENSVNDQNLSQIELNDIVHEDP